MFISLHCTACGVCVELVFDKTIFRDTFIDCLIILEGGFLSYLSLIITIAKDFGKQRDHQQLLIQIINKFITIAFVKRLIVYSLLE